MRIISAASLLLIFVIGSILFSGLTACTNFPRKTVSQAVNVIDREEDDTLPQTVAAARKKQISGVAYDLFFKFEKKSDHFSSIVKIRVSLNETNQALSLDSLNQAIESLTVNGTIVNDYVLQTGHLEIPAKYLKPHNDIEIRTTTSFSHNGEGFKHVADPADGSEYLYSDFEPYDAHRMFPCFDQPDLKAKFNVIVEAPTDWVVISNALIARTETKSDRLITSFIESKPISTYLFFLGAGPFVEFKDQEGATPLFLYSRKSLAKFVDHKRFFDTTKRGLRFYADYFGQPYPFTKYAHIFMPEFAPSGMENPGAVVISERYVLRGPLTPSARLHADSLILHEMAHMWFGDLVTMSWWNDLWLNESFATYAASLALDRAMRSGDAWLNFLDVKSWGYHDDQLVSSHPVETVVPDTRAARGNFDGITYGKGAAALQQLHHLVGEDAFRKGLRAYFAQHAWGNTTRSDFTAAISKAAGRNLDVWTSTWLQSAGPNHIGAVWDCTKGKINSFSLRQTTNRSGLHAPHRTKVGLYKNGPFLKLYKSVDVESTRSETLVPELKNLDCPDFVDPNLGDYDYAVNDLDAVSMRLVMPALTGKLASALGRGQLWQTMIEQVRGGQMPAAKFFEVMTAALASEKSTGILSFVTDRRGSMPDFYFRYLKPGERDALAVGLEKVLWDRRDQLEFLDLYLQFARTPESVQRIKDILTGHGSISLDQDRRWVALRTLARLNVKDITEMLAAEIKRDQTSDGVRSAFAARIEIPSLEVKREFWDELTKAPKHNFDDLRFASHGFQDTDSPEIFESMSDEYFKHLETLDWSVNDASIPILLEYAFPLGACTAATLTRSEASMKASLKLTPLAKRQWLEANDELARCIKSQALVTKK